MIAAPSLPTTYTVHRLRGRAPGNLDLARRFAADPIDFMRLLGDIDADLILAHLGPFEMVIPRHPDLVHEVLVKDARSYHKWDRQKQVFGKFDGNGLVNSDGDFWRKQRRLIQPAFHHKRLAAYGETMARLAREHLTRWTPGAPFEIGRAMSHLTRDIVAEILFGADVSAHTGRVSEIMEIIQWMAFEEFGAIVPLPDWLPTPAKRRQAAALRDLEAILTTFIDARRAHGVETDDLLSMLLHAADENGGHMDDKQIRDEVTTLFLAGHETTSTAMAWLFAMLAMHPHTEVDARAAIVPLGDRAPGFADLPALGAIRQVIDETMRLYPPTYIYPRQAAAATTLGGHPIAPGMVIEIAPYLLHHDARWWPEPQRFDPSRFAPGMADTRPDNSYLAFGDGPRVCIGNSFALMEMTLIVAIALQSWRWTLAPGQTLPAGEPLITLRPKGGVQIVVMPASAAKTG